MKRYIFLILVWLPCAAVLANGVIDVELASGSGSGWTYDGREQLTIVADGDYFLTGSNVPTSRCVRVLRGVSADITLCDVHLDRSAASGAAIDVSGAAVNIFLEGSSTLKGGIGCAGLQVASDSGIGRLRIFGSGSLAALGGSGAAGIGGGCDVGGGRVDVGGGHIAATGGRFGAAIGAGCAGMLDSVVVAGGTIVATSGADSYGIGARYICIDGGSVDAGTGGNICATQPNNSAGRSVYLNTLTIGNPHVAERTAVESGRIGGVMCSAVSKAAQGVYGIRDVRTDARGCVYFYLPDSKYGTTLMLADAQGTAYSSTRRCEANNDGRDTLTASASADNSEVQVREICLAGATLQSGTGTYLASCGAQQVWFEIVVDRVDARVVCNGSESSLIAVDVSRADIYAVDYSVILPDGTTQHRQLKVESRFALDAIVDALWNSVASVNNNPNTNGGYRFAGYEWYCNEQLVSTGQHYAAANRNELDYGAAYRLVLHTTDGKVLRTCAGTMPRPAPAVAMRMKNEKERIENGE